MQLNPLGQVMSMPNFLPTVAENDTHAADAQKAPDGENYEERLIDAVRDAGTIGPQRAKDIPAAGGSSSFGAVGADRSSQSQNHLTRNETPSLTHTVDVESCAANAMTIALRPPEQKSPNVSVTSGNQNGHSATGVGGVSATSVQRQLDPLHRTNLFVSGFSADVTDSDLYKIFRVCGPICLCEVVREPVTCASRCVGFVQFVEAVGADAAVTSLNNTLIDRDADGKPSFVLRVRYASDERGGSTNKNSVSSYNSSGGGANGSGADGLNGSGGSGGGGYGEGYAAMETNKIFVRHVPAYATTRQLSNHFSQFGTVTSCTIHKDISRKGLLEGTNMNMAYVTFQQNVEAERAARVEHINMVLGEAGEVCAGPLIVKLAETLARRNTRLSASQRQSNQHLLSHGAAGPALPVYQHHHGAPPPPPPPMAPAGMPTMFGAVPQQLAHQHLHAQSAAFAFQPMQGVPGAPLAFVAPNASFATAAAAGQPQFLQTAMGGGAVLMQPQYATAYTPQQLMFAAPQAPQVVYMTTAGGAPQFTTLAPGAAVMLPDSSGALFATPSGPSYMTQ